MENTSLTDVTLTGGLTVTTTSAQQMSVSSVSLNFTKIEMKYSGTARSSLMITGLSSDGALNVSAISAANVTASSVQASDIFLKLDGIKGSSVADNTSLSDITLTGGLSVTSSSVQALTIDGIKGESIYMKLDN